MLTKATSASRVALSLRVLMGVVLLLSADCANQRAARNQSGATTDTSESQRAAKEPPPTRGYSVPTVDIGSISQGIISDDSVGPLSGYRVVIVNRWVGVIRDELVGVYAGHNFEGHGVIYEARTPLNNALETRVDELHPPVVSANFRIVSVDPQNRLTISAANGFRFFVEPDSELVR